MAVQQEVVIKVAENNDAFIIVAITTISSLGEQPYDLTGVSDIIFYGKKGKAVSDAYAFATYSMTGGQILVIPPPTNGQISIQMSKADLLQPQVARYHIDVIKNTLTETVMAGAFVIQDT